MAAPARASSPPFRVVDVFSVERRERDWSMIWVIRAWSEGSVEVRHCLRRRWRSRAADFRVSY
jgi:hypothetical protein